MKRFLIKGIVVIGLATTLIFSTVTLAFAADPGTQGQPSQSCQSVFPSGTFTPNGFNTSGFANAANHYAGSQPQNSNNPNSVSQYDVACFQTSQH